MKKIITVALVIFTLIGALSLSCYAYSESTSDSSETEAPSENFFEVAYKGFLENSDRLLAALAFAGSLLVAFAYKKGLIPLIKASLGALSAAVSKLKEESAKTSAEACDAIATASEKLDAAGAVIEALGKRLDSIEKQLDAANEGQKKGESIYAVISTQIDMLYELFMASGIPQFQKEAVAERVKIMKEAIRTNEDGKEST